VLRARCRLNSSLRPIAASNGKAVIESALPTAPAKQQTVFRSRLTQGSRLVRMRLLVRTWIWLDRAAASLPPQVVTTFAHIFRKARSLAIARKNWQPMLDSKTIWRVAVSMSKPAPVMARRYSTAVATANAKS